MSDDQPKLSPSERLSIINALVAQDRTEIRGLQDSVFKLTYYVIPGFIGIAAYAGGHAHLKHVLGLGQILILLVYVIAFFTFKKWLREGRACLRIREAYYVEQQLLYSDPFEPIRKIEDRDRASGFEDNALWFPFGVTLLAATVLFTYTLMPNKAPEPTPTSVTAPAAQGPRQP